MNKRRDAFNSWKQTDTGASPPSPVDMIAAPGKRLRDRAWERENRASSYVIPGHLRETASQLREDILAIVQYDENGEPRDDRTTVNEVATALMDWALMRVEREPGLLNFTPNPHSRGHMTVFWEEVDGWENRRIQLPVPTRRTTTRREKKMYLGYRWTIPDIDQRVRELAGKGSFENPRKKNPFTHAVPLGEVVVKLLSLAVKGYKERRFTMTIKQVAISQTAAGWEALRSK